jgi:hypothetical protein
MLLCFGVHFIVMLTSIVLKGACACSCSRPRQQYAVCDDGRLHTVYCNTDCVWIQHQSCVGSEPIKLTSDASFASTGDNRKRVAVCITGQIRRLELESKLRNLFPHLKAYSVVVFGVFGSEVHHSRTFRTAVKADYRALYNGSLAQVAQTIVTTSKVEAVWLYEYNQSDVSAEISFSADRVYVRGALAATDAKKFELSRVHLLQFDGLLRMHYFVESYERHVGRTFDYVLRIRDDAYVVAHLTISRLIGRLESTNSSVLTSACGLFGGLNDHYAFFRRQVMKALFTAQMRGFYGDILSHNATKICNPEMLLMHQLHADGVSHSRVSPCNVPVITVRRFPAGPCFDHDDFLVNVNGASCNGDKNTAWRLYNPFACTQTGLIPKHLLPFSTCGVGP